MKSNTFHSNKLPLLVFLFTGILIPSITADDVPKYLDSKWLYC